MYGTILQPKVIHSSSKMAHCSAAVYWTAYILLNIHEHSNTPMQMKLLPVQQDHLIELRRRFMRLFNTGHIQGGPQTERLQGPS